MPETSLCTWQRTGAIVHLIILRTTQFAASNTAGTAVVIITATTAGYAGNSIGLKTTIGNGRLTLGGANLAGGSDPQANIWPSITFTRDAAELCLRHSGRMTRAERS